MGDKHNPIHVSGYVTISTVAFSLPGGTGQAVFTAYAIYRKESLQMVESRWKRQLNRRKKGTTPAD